MFYAVHNQNAGLSQMGPTVDVELHKALKKALNPDASKKAKQNPTAIGANNHNVGTGTRQPTSQTTVESSSQPKRVSSTQWETELATRAKNAPTPAAGGGRVVASRPSVFDTLGIGDDEDGDDATTFRLSASAPGNVS